MFFRRTHSASSLPAENPEGTASSSASSLPLAQVRRILQQARRLRAARERAAATVSRERGPGLAAWGLAEYQPGDDARRIDWLATLRLDRPVVREYHRDKERIVLIALDASASLRTAAPAAFARARETATVLLVAALLEGERAGGLLFTDRIERELPPDAGRGQAGRALRFFSGTLDDVGGGTDFGPLLKRAGRLPREALLVVVSDFAAPIHAPRWRALGRRLQVRWLQMRSGAMLPLDRAGYLRVADSEKPGTPQVISARTLRGSFETRLPHLAAIPHAVLHPGQSSLPVLAALLH